MYIKQKYVGICSKCNSDVFVDVYEQKLDLIQTCDCTDNQIECREWWETYIFYPMTWKVVTLPFLLFLLNPKLVQIVGIVWFFYALYVWYHRKFRINNKVDTWHVQHTNNN